MTHQPDRVAQVVAWLRERGTSKMKRHNAAPMRMRPLFEADALFAAAIAIEAGEPFKETPDE